MKILLLCWRDTTHPQGGGSERYLERVAEYLASHGHEVIVQSARHTDAPRVVRRGHVTYLKAGGKYTVYPAALLHLALGCVGLGRLRGVDVVVDTQNGIPFAARLLAPRSTIVLTHHCHREQWPVAGKLLGALGWLIESRVSPRLNRGAPYVTVSEHSAAELVELGVPKRNITVIRNGVDPVPQEIPLLEEDGRIHLATLARLVPHKRIEHAIEAAAALAGGKTGGRTITLDIIGSGWWEDELRAYAQRYQGVENLRMCFHGQVSEPYKHALLERAAVHLMPSQTEGWGLAVIEAAQHGVPTVGYRSAGGLNDSVVDGGTGVLVADGVAAFTAGVARLLDNPCLRERLGKNAAERAKLFTWEKTGEEFAELIRAVGCGKF